jgi:hypothetical protein
MVISLQQARWLDYTNLSPADDRTPAHLPLIAFRRMLLAMAHVQQRPCANCGRGWYIGLLHPALLPWKSSGSHRTWSGLDALDC